MSVAMPCIDDEKRIETASNSEEAIPAVHLRIMQQTIHLERSDRCPISLQPQFAISRRYHSKRCEGSMGVAMLQAQLGPSAGWPSASKRLERPTLAQAGKGSFDCVG
jgi:hypothetical protein